MDRVLTVIVYPFYILGVVVGFVVWVVLLVGAAVVEGFKDGKRGR